MADRLQGTSAAALAPALLTFGGALAASYAWARVRRARFTFRGRTVVITGGSRGLGFALARQFADEGARLVLLARNADELASAERRLRAAGARDVETVVCDVREKDQVDRTCEWILREHGRIDVLVNNAGVIQATPFEHAQLEDFQESLAVHFWGPLHLIRACLPQMRRQGGGRIINIASIGGRISVPHLLPYGVGKFALVGLSEGLNAELRRYGVRVTTVTPHLMRTGSYRNVTVRGQHRKEAIWFALGTATALTSISADRGARMIVEASRNGRASLTPGRQARLAELAHAIAPETVAALSAAAAWILPAPARDGRGDAPRFSRDIDTGRAARVFATDAARRFNQPLARDEAARQ